MIKEFEQMLCMYLKTIEPQELYFTGHRHFHALHTQLVIDNAGYINYAEARNLGHQNNAKQFTMIQQICANGPLLLLSIPCLFSSVLHFNLPSMITANQLLLSIPCFKCVVLLLYIFNNYLPLRYTTTPTGVEVQHT
jgi:hypothetical protein